MSLRVIVSATLCSTGGFSPSLVRGETWLNFERKSTLIARHLIVVESYSRGFVLMQLLRKLKSLFCWYLMKAGSLLLIF